MIDLTSDETPSSESSEEPSDTAPAGDASLNANPTTGPSFDQGQQLDDEPIHGSGQWDGTETGTTAGSAYPWSPFPAPTNPFSSAAPNMLPDVISYDQQMTDDEQLLNDQLRAALQDGAAPLSSEAGHLDPWTTSTPALPPLPTDPTTSLDATMDDQPPSHNQRPQDSTTYNDEAMEQPQQTQPEPGQPEQSASEPDPIKPPAWMDPDHQMWWYIVTDHLLDQAERTAEALVEELTEAGVHMNLVGPQEEPEQRATIDALIPELDGNAQLRKMLELVAEAQRLARADTIDTIRVYRWEKARGQLFAAQQGWFPAREVRSVTHLDQAGRLQGVFSLPPLAGDPSGAEKYRVQSNVPHFALIDAEGVESALQEDLPPLSDIAFVAFESDGTTATLPLQDGSSKTVPLYSVARYLYGMLRHAEDIMVLDAQIAVWDTAMDPLEHPVAGQVLANLLGRTVWGSSAGGVLELAPASQGKPVRVRLRRIHGAPPGAKLKLVAFRPEPTETVLRSFATKITGDAERWKEVRRWVRALRWWYGPPLPARTKTFQDLLAAFWQLEQRRASSGDTEPLSWDILVKEMAKRELPPDWRPHTGRQAALLSQLLRLDDRQRGPWLAPTYALPEADLPLARPGVELGLAWGDDLGVGDPLEEMMAWMADTEERIPAWPWGQGHEPDVEEETLARRLLEAMGDPDQVEEIEEDEEDPAQ